MEIYPAILRGGLTDASNPLEHQIPDTVTKAMAALLELGEAAVIRRIGNSTPLFEVSRVFQP